MWYRARNVKYWQKGDNKCQYGRKKNRILSVIDSISTTYATNGLAQKLQYFCSPIKNTYW